MKKYLKSKQLLQNSILYFMEMLRVQSQYFQLKNGAPVFEKKVFVFQKLFFKV